MPLRAIAIAGASLLLLAIAWCALSSSPNMREMWWIPNGVGAWADRNPNLRNFPAFALLAATIYLLVSAFPPSDVRHPLGLGAFAAFAASALGVLLEAVQLVLPTRTASWADVGWTVAGSAAGGFVSALLVLLTRKALTRTNSP